MALELGFGPMEIRGIEKQNSGDPAEQTKSFLREWIWKNGNSATYGKLCDVLKKLKLQGAADEVCKIAQNN